GTVQPVLRDAAKYAAVLEAPARVALLTRQAGRVVADVRERVDARGDALLEVASAVQLGRNVRLALGHRVGAALVFLAEEEEEPRPVFVEHAGDEHGAVDRVPAVVA